MTAPTQSENCSSDARSALVTRVPVSPDFSCIFHSGGIDSTFGDSGGRGLPASSQSSAACFHLICAIAVRVPAISNPAADAAGGSAAMCERVENFISSVRSVLQRVYGRPRAPDCAATNILQRNRVKGPTGPQWPRHSPSSVEPHQRPKSPSPRSER